MDSFTELTAGHSNKYRIYTAAIIVLLVIVSWLDFFDRMSAQYVNSATDKYFKTSMKHLK